MFSRKLEDVSNYPFSSPAAGIGGGFFRRGRTRRKSSSVPAPILLGFALHRGRVGVLALDPVRRAARPVARVLPLRHNAFEPELAGMVEHERAILLHVLIQQDARDRSGKQ